MARVLQDAPTSPPPGRYDKWCPLCRRWYEHTGSRRCFVCGAAVLRQGRAEALKPGELRPGVVAEFEDTR